MRQPRQQQQMPPQLKRHGNLGVQRSLGAHVPVGDRLGKRSPLGRRRLGVHSLGRGFSSAFMGAPPSGEKSAGERSAGDRNAGERSAGDRNAGDSRREGSRVRTGKASTLGRSQPSFRSSSASEKLSAQLSDQGNIRQGEASTSNPTQNSTSRDSAANRQEGSSPEGNGLRGKRQAETLPENPLGRFSSEASAPRSMGTAIPARAIGAATPAHLGQNLMQPASSRLSTPLGSQLNSGLTTPSNAEGMSPQNSASPQNTLAPTPSLQRLSQPSEPAFGPAPEQSTPANDPKRSTGKPAEKNKDKNPEKNNPQSSFAPSSALPNSTNSGDTLPNSTPSSSVLPNSTRPNSTRPNSTRPNSTRANSTQAPASVDFSPQDSGDSLPAQPLGKGLSNSVQRTLALAQKLHNQPLAAGKSARDQGSFPRQQSDSPATGNPGSRVNSNKLTTEETSRKTAASLQPLDTLVKKVTDTISTVSKTVLQKSSAAERNKIANGASDNGAISPDALGGGALAVEGLPSARKPLGMSSKGRTVQRKPLGSVLAHPLQRKTSSANAPQPSPSPASSSATNLPAPSAPATSNRPSSAVGDLIQRQATPQAQNSTAQNSTAQNSTAQNSTAAQPTTAAPSAPISQAPAQQTQPAKPVPKQTQPIQAKADSPIGNTNVSVTSTVAASQASPNSVPQQPSQPVIQRQETPASNPLQTPSLPSLSTEEIQKAETPGHTANPSAVQAKHDSSAPSDSSSSDSSPSDSSPSDSSPSDSSPSDSSSSDNASARISDLVQRQADNSQQQPSLPSTAPQTSQATVQEQADFKTDSPQSSSFQQTSTESVQNIEAPDNTSAQPSTVQASTVQASTVQAKHDAPTVPANASDSVSNLVQRQADNSQQQPTSPNRTHQSSQPAIQQKTAQKQTDSTAYQSQSPSPQSPSVEIPSLPNPSAERPSPENVQNLFQRQADGSQQQSSSPSFTPQPSQPAVQRQADSANSSSQNPFIQNPSRESVQNTETSADAAAQSPTVEAQHDATITPNNTSERIGNLVQRQLVQRQVDSNQLQSPAPRTLPQPSQPIVQQQGDATTNPPQRPGTQRSQQTITSADAAMRSPTPEATSDTPDAPNTASDRIGELVQRQVASNQLNSNQLDSNQLDSNQLDSNQLDSNQPKPLPPSGTPQPSQPTVQLEVQRQAIPVDNPPANHSQQNVQSTLTSAEPANPADKSEPSVPSAPSQEVQETSKAPASAIPPSLQRPVQSSADEPPIQRKEQPSPSAAIIQRQPAPPSDAHGPEPSEATLASPASRNKSSVQRQIETSEPNTPTKSLRKNRSEINPQDAISPNPVGTAATETTSVENVTVFDHNDPKRPTSEQPTSVQRQADTSEPIVPTTARPTQQDAIPKGQKPPSQPALPPSHQPALHSQSLPPAAPSPAVQRKSAEGKNPVLAQPHLASQEASSAQPSAQTVQQQAQNAEPQDTAHPTVQTNATTPPTKSPPQSETTPNSRKQDTPAAEIDSSPGLPAAFEPDVQRQATVQRRFSLSDLHPDLRPDLRTDLTELSPPTSVVELADQISTFPEDIFPEDVFPENVFPEDSFPEDIFPEDSLPEDSEPSDLFNQPSVLDIAELVPEKDDIRSAVQAAAETVENSWQPSVSAAPNNQFKAQNTVKSISDSSVAPAQPDAQPEAQALTAPRTSVEHIVNQSIETLSPDLSQGETITHEVIQKLNALPSLSPQKPLGPPTISKHFTDLATAPQPLEALLSVLSQERTSHQPDHAKSSWQSDALAFSQLASTLPQLSNGTGLETAMASAQSAMAGIGQTMDAASATQTFLPSADNGSEGGWESQFDLPFDLPLDLSFDINGLAAPKDASKQEPWAKQFKFDSQVEPKSDLQAAPGKQSQNSGPGDSLDRVSQEDTENPTDIAAGEVIKSQNTEFANEPTDSGLGDEETRESEGTKATNAGRFDTKPEEKVDDEKMELLARKFYQLLRLRLEDERNGHSNIFSGASPWADIMTFPQIGDSKSEAPKILQKDTEAPSLEMDRKVNDLIEALYQHILSQSLAERTSEGWFYPK